MSSSDQIPPCPFRARVLHSYEPYESKEIPLLANTVVNVLRVHASGWWRGEYNGKSGWFPSSHVQPIVPGAAPQLPAPEAAAHAGRSRMSATFSRIQERLSRFFGGQRAKRRELEQRGVLASDQTRVFGRTIWDIVERDRATGVRNGIPLFLDRCFDVLWTSGFGVEGLFRVPAAQAQLTSFREQLDKDPLGVQFNAEQDAGICGGLVKLFLREHPEPFVSPAFYAQYLAAGDPERPLEAREALIAQVISAERAPVRAFLERLLSFLYECVTNHHQTMRMLPKAYATIFGPVIVTDSVETRGCNLADIGAQIGCFELLVTRWDRVAALLDAERHSSAHQLAPPPQERRSENAQASQFDTGTLVVAGFDFDPGADSKKIALAIGDCLLLDRAPENGWCRGARVVGGALRQGAGDRGWFPESHVQLAPNQAAARDLLNQTSQC